jgi:hypothetical protein
MFGRLFGASMKPVTSRPKPRRGSLLLERLEDRWCPTGFWDWVGPPGVNTWSNATGTSWVHNGGLAPAGDYPGLPGITDDEVFFRNAAAGPATLDVAIAPLRSLEITAWNDRLTLAASLTVSGATGHFTYSDPGAISTIVLNANTSLKLLDLSSPAAQPNNSWTAGRITGGANTAFQIVGSPLAIQGSPTFLATPMTIERSTNPPFTPGDVILDNMTGNLDLQLTSYIEVEDGGVLEFNQQIAAGQQNQDGGIDINANHVGAFAVQVDGGGIMRRGGAPLPNVPDQVAIGTPVGGIAGALGAAVYNDGGSVVVGGGTMLNLSGKDTHGYSYWQDDADSVLKVYDTSNINAIGKYEIDLGTVVLTAQSGAVPNFDALDGEALIFGNAGNTIFQIEDSNFGTPGQVNVGGPVTMSANTTVKMNFLGATNKADLLNVSLGDLKLKGTLDLTSRDNQPQLPTAALIFFADSGPTPSITDNFTLIKDNALGTSYTRWVDDTNPNVYYWNVLIS